MELFPKTWWLWLGLLLTGGAAGWSLGKGPSARPMPPVVEEAPPPRPPKLTDSGRSPQGAGLRALLAEEERHASIAIEDYPEIVDKILEEARSYDELWEVMRDWARRDLEGCLAYLSQKGERMRSPRRRSQTDLGSCVLRALAKDDPDKAMETIPRLPGDPNLRRWDLLSQITQDNPEQATAFARQHADPLAAARQSSGSWYRIDPLKALPVINEIEPGTLRDGMAKQLCRYYYAHPDPEAAGAGTWFAQLPNDLKAVAQKELQRDYLIGLRTPENRTVLRRLFGVEQPDAARTDAAGQGQ